MASVVGEEEECDGQMGVSLCFGAFIRVQLCRSTFKVHKQQRMSLL